MELQTSIHWTLYLGDTRLSFQENLLEKLNNSKLDDEVASDFDILQLLQEVYYIDQLSTSEEYHPNEKLSLQDKGFDYVRAFHDLIKELLEKGFKQITKDDVLDVNLCEEMKGKRGFIFDNYVDRYLTEPFIFRNGAYKIFSLLPKKYKPQLSNYSRWDIVAFPDVFAKYWSDGLLAIVTMHNDIYKDDISLLKKKLRELNTNKSLKNIYLKKGKGCFSKTEVIKNGKREDVLCFSGVYFVPDIKTAINTIVNSGHFSNPTSITTPSKVRYYICPAQYITYDEAKASGVTFNSGMFSCCERKTIAEYDWQGVSSYTMLVKYPPCELCQFPVWMHINKYNGKVNQRIGHYRTNRQNSFDAIARIIYINKKNNP